MYDEYMPGGNGEYHEWEYTNLGRDAYGDSYLNRRLITRDSPIRDGVYYGTYGGEAIVVDPARNPLHYNQWFKLVTEAASLHGQVQRHKILDATYSTILKQMPYSQKKVDGILARIATHEDIPRFPDGRKVELSVFMAAHVGVCRHQALAAGVMLEMARDEGHIRGQVSIDRNIRWSPKGEPDGHAWIRYTSFDHELYILDVAQEVHGRLLDLPPKIRQRYLRPEEQRGLLGPAAGRLVLPESGAIIPTVETSKPFIPTE